MSAQVGRFVTSKDGTKIWADDAGNKEGIPVIFIHGLACTGHAWDKQFHNPALLENLYMVRYELRGHSRSDYPWGAEWYTQQKYAEDFMAVCEGFGLKKPFVCGWSLGAATVCDVAQIFGPDIIAGVIFAGGPVITHSHHSNFSHAELRSNFPSFLDPSGDKQPQAAHVFVDSCLKYPARDLPYETRLKWLGGYLMQPPSIRKWTFSRAQEWDKWEKEFASKTPHLLVQGREDKHSDTEKMLPIAQGVLPHMEIKIIEDIGHAPAYEAAEEHDAYLLDFVLRVSGKKA
ncbi:alpha/beta-hydrolase [Cristinia sonorae]|uniref:Alpha/beta-hydrolase n=1 Tax=Cristinia sonorae TaxID=1940300 RepID=A0A8K0XTL3_9AGAR|nr:alpha/beta-hydrolase [Cristinia sonorae]